MISLLDQIDRREESDPYDIYEMPVVRDDDGSRRLSMAESTSAECPNHHDEKGDQTARDMEAVKSSSEIED